MQGDGIETINYIRQRLNEKGGLILRKLGLYFKHFDTVHSEQQLLTQQEFCEGLRNLGMNLGQNDLQSLCEMLDTTNCGQIDYQEFLVGLRGRMNAKRQGTYLL